MHLPPRLRFEIGYEGNVATLSLLGGAPEGVSHAQITTLSRELSELIMPLHVRDLMFQLISGPFADDYDQVALILQHQTKRRVSVRTLQAWMMPPGRPSSRTCPEWALAALKKYLADNPNTPTQFAEGARVLRGMPNEDIRSATLFRSQQLVPAADALLERENEIRRKWRDCPMNELHERFAEYEIASERKLSELTVGLLILERALSTSSTLEELKERVTVDGERRFGRMCLTQETAEDIRQEQKEFAGEDGVLPGSVMS